MLPTQSIPHRYILLNTCDDTRVSRQMLEILQLCRRIAWAALADNDLQIINEISSERQEESVDNTGKEHPWPYLESIFRYKGKDNNSVKFICRLCSPLVKEISAFISSPSNLRKHVEVSVFIPSMPVSV